MVYLDIATALRFTPLNINSKHIKTDIACFFVKAPYNPMEKRIAPIMRNLSSVKVLPFSH